jgi:hypothetical protein
LSPAPLRTFYFGLAYLFKLAGVELIREQVRAALPAAATSYDITPGGLVLWLDQRHGKSVVYDWKNANGLLVPRAGDGGPAPEWPSLEVTRVMFAREPLYWDEWFQAWDQICKGRDQAALTAQNLDLGLDRPRALPPGTETHDDTLN